MLAATCPLAARCAALGETGQGPELPLPELPAPAAAAPSKGASHSTAANWRSTWRSRLGWQPAPTPHISEGAPLQHW